jgi:hypothetical protein
MPGRPVLIEVYLLRCRPDGLLAYRREAGPLGPGEAPDTAATRVGGGPYARPGAVLHSTSWRHLGDGTIVLAYAALPDPQPGRPAVAIRDFAVAVSGDAARPSPAEVRHDQVAAHAARHLALIAGTDPAVRLALDQFPELGRALVPLVPVPAGQLGR